MLGILLFSPMILSRDVERHTPSSSHAEERRSVLFRHFSAGPGLITLLQLMTGPGHKVTIMPDDPRVNGEMYAFAQGFITCLHKLITAAIGICDSLSKDISPP